MKNNMLAWFFVFAIVGFAGSYYFGYTNSISDVETLKQQLSDSREEMEETKFQFKQRMNVLHSMTAHLRKSINTTEMTTLHETVEFYKEGGPRHYFKY